MYRFLALLALAIAVSCLSAQETINNASLAGRVTDPTGALLPHTIVTAHATATNVATKVETDAAGRFRFPYLHVGQYQVTVHHDGFADAMRLEYGEATGGLALRYANAFSAGYRDYFTPEEAVEDIGRIEGVLRGDGAGGAIAARLTSRTRAETYSGKRV